MNNHNLFHKIKPYLLRKKRNPMKFAGKVIYKRG